MVFCMIYLPAIIQQQLLLHTLAQYLHNYTQKTKYLQLLTLRNFYIYFQLLLFIPHSGKLLSYLSTQITVPFIRSNPSQLILTIE